MINITLNGKIVQRSKNLRGIISRAHKVGVAEVSVWKEKLGTFGPADIYVLFMDGTECRTTFAEHGSAIAFFRKRYQKWGLTHEVRCSERATVFQG